MEQVYVEKKLCTGCSACVASCPQNAISMIKNKEGFEYPVVEKDKCVDCKLCSKICPIGKNMICDVSIKRKYYAVKNKNDDVRRKSASGGVFSAIADYVFENGGVVYGAAFVDDLEVRHIRIDKRNDLDLLRGSKYVQSNIQSVYKMIKNDLNEGREVLFVGTPCQIAGIRSAFKHVGENLILCDIVCHGVPSPMIFQGFLDWLEKKERKKIRKIIFRDKERGWQQQKWKVQYEDGTEQTDTPNLNVYKNIFYKHLALRCSCHQCQYTNLERIGDITIGDYWGIESVIPDFVDELGISLVIVNTVIGKMVFDMISTKLEYRETKKEECLQPQLQYPTKASENRGRFFYDYQSSGMDYVINKYVKTSLVKRVKHKCLRIIKRRNLNEKNN